jgi:DNA polymerase-3 subunit epsilon
VIPPLFIAAYRGRIDTSWSDEAPIEGVRFVVVDTETSGLDPRLDRIVTIGAVGVLNGEIVLEDRFASLVRVDDPGAVTVHGVTPADTRRGVDERDALEAFLAYVADGVIVGHHIGHDLATFDAAYERHWGARLLNRSLDTMDLTLWLERDGAFAGQPPFREFTLDALCERFGVIPHDRHTATGDAFLTAQVLLRLLSLAARHGRTRLRDITQTFVAE